MFSATPEELLFRKMRKKCHILPFCCLNHCVNPCDLIKFPAPMHRHHSGTQTASTTVPGNIALGLRTGSPVTLRNLQSEDWRMLSKFPFIVCVLALVSLFAVSSANADSVPVVNADFSQLGAPLSNSCRTNCAWNYGPIPGWTISSGTVAGSQELNSNYYYSLP